jgi:hypothetical protein
MKDPHIFAHAGGHKLIGNDDVEVFPLEMMQTKDYFEINASVAIIKQIVGSGNSTDSSQAQMVASFSSTSSVFLPLPVITEKLTYKLELPDTCRGLHPPHPRCILGRGESWGWIALKRSARPAKKHPNRHHGALHRCTGSSRSPTLKRRHAQIRKHASLIRRNTPADMSVTGDYPQRESRPWSWLCGLSRGPNTSRSQKRSSTVEECGGLFSVRSRVLTGSLDISSDGDGLPGAPRPSMSALLMCLNEMRRHDDFRLSLRALLHP